jgi:psiF repeat-containing protein
MLKPALQCVLACALVATAVLPATATDPQPNAKIAQATSPKPLTPQQQKMKDCAAKWKEEKASTGAKGRDAQKKFMSECLKQTST